MRSGFASKKMKVTRFALLASLTARSVAAFAPARTLTVDATRIANRNVVCWSSSSSTSTQTTDSEAKNENNNICDAPKDNSVESSVRLANRPQGGKILRDLELTAVDGSTVNLGTQMGDGTAVVVFLRHLG